MANQTIGKDDEAVLDDMLPVDPFRSLYVHFGMLLGVEDFRTLDAYHRGKSWYHSAWLHGPGVVWGLGVTFDGRDGAAPVGGADGAGGTDDADGTDDTDSADGAGGSDEAGDPDGAGGMDDTGGTDDADGTDDAGEADNGDTGDGEEDGTEDGAGGDFEVESPAASTGEIKVLPGAALDALGRELQLPSAACLNLAAWYAAHESDAELRAAVTVDPDSGEVVFDGHVSISFDACLDRQVPALTEPCEGASGTTAYSRVVESVRLSLHPGRAPRWRADGRLPFHRVRLLFGLERALERPDQPGVPTADDQAVLDARAGIVAAPAAERAAECLRWLRHFAVLDEMIAAPEQPEPGGPLSPFPARHPAPVYLADVSNVRLRRDADRWRVIDATLDNLVRPVHLPTATVQELLCGSLVGGGEGGGGESGGGEGEGEGEGEGGGGEGGDGEAPVPPVAPVGDAGGPRIDGDSIVLEDDVLRFDIVGGPLLVASVEARGVHVGEFRASGRERGWTDIDIVSVAYEARSSRVEVTLAAAPSGNPVRIIVSGTGRHPFLDRDRLPLAGAVGGPPGTRHDGNDFVFMLDGS